MDNLKPFRPGYTSKEVAKMLGVEASTVRSWISRKELRALKVENRRYITPTQLQDFYKNRGKKEYVDMTYANGPVSYYHIT